MCKSKCLIQVLCLTSGVLPDNPNIRGAPPWSQPSEEKHLGKKRIMVSPSPVAAAAPAVLSAYAPAPAIGESPTRLNRDWKEEGHINRTKIGG